jgi:trehalose 6-phosphate phosphatase
MTEQTMPLPRDVVHALTALAARPCVLLGVDYDGTLAPLVTNPMEAVAAPGGLEALRAAVALDGVHVAVVSGRDLATLRQLTGIGEDEPIVLVGSHGAQTSRGFGTELLDETQARTLERLTAGLEGIVARHEGPRVERKPASVVLHTRDVEESAARESTAAAHRLAADHDGVHVTPGKEVVELSVVDATKGAALRSLAEALRVDATAYFGDDVTDERAFAALDPSRGDVCVKVGPGDTLAAHRLADIPGVVAALETFVSLRAAAARA